MIITGNWFFANHQADTPKPIQYETYFNRIVIPLVRKRGAPIRRPDVEKDGTVQAHVNHSAWKIECQNRNCRGYEEAFEEGLFFCLSCMNSHVDHRIIMSRFPAQRKHIEELLNVRPVPNRNWETWQPIDQLVVENEENADKLIDSTDSVPTLKELLS